MLDSLTGCLPNRMLLNINRCQDVVRQLQHDVVIGVPCVVLLGPRQRREACLGSNDGVGGAAQSGRGSGTFPETDREPAPRIQRDRADALTERLRACKR
jgi:hypothetical protein